VPKQQLLLPAAVACCCCCLLLGAHHDLHHTRVAVFPDEQARTTTCTADAFLFSCLLAGGPRRRPANHPLVRLSGLGQIEVSRPGVAALTHADAPTASGAFRL
jgi:hypothetical protein